MADSGGTKPRSDSGAGDANWESVEQAGLVIGEGAGAGGAGSGAAASGEGAGDSSSSTGQAGIGSGGSGSGGGADPFWVLNGPSDLQMVSDLACQILGPHDPTAAPDTGAWAENLKTAGWDSNIIKKDFTATDEKVQLWYRKEPSGMRLVDHATGLMNGTDVSASNGKPMQWNLAIGLYRNMDAGKAHRMWMDGPHRPKWDSYTFKCCSVDEAVCSKSPAGPPTVVMHHETKFPFPFSNRDYVYSR